jgi:hypothetical protein
MSLAARPRRKRQRNKGRDSNPYLPTLIYVFAGDHEPVVLSTKIKGARHPSTRAVVLRAMA